MELPQGESGSLYAVSVFTSVFYFMLSEGRVDKASVSALKMAHLNYKGFVCGDSVVKRIILPRGKQNTSHPGFSVELISGLCPYILTACFQSKNYLLPL